MSDYWDYNIVDKAYEKRVNELYDLSDKLDCEKKTIIEIGTWKGTSAISFSKKFEKVYSLDIVESSVNNLNNKKIDNITALLRNDVVVNSFDDTSVDVIYIDGDHTYGAVLSDLKELTPKVKKGGYICGHDYQGNVTGVQKAVNEFFGRVPDILTPSHSCDNCQNFAYKI